MPVIAVESQDKLSHNIYSQKYGRDELPTHWHLLIGGLSQSQAAYLAGLINDIISCKNPDKVTATYDSSGKVIKLQ